MIASIDKAGVSSYSQLVCEKAKLISPKNLRAEVLHWQNAILLKWTDVSAAIGYKIQRKDDLSSFTTIGYLRDSSYTKFIDMKNIIADTQYTYVVYAFDNTNESLPTSDLITATVLHSRQQQKAFYPLVVRYGDLVTEKVRIQIQNFAFPR